ncbi:polyadenylate-binding protein 7-like [Cynara cardunculus var. scolymus]|uniref:polyadenylate-binding protein 7-like n=1 Tax=Cynara cardunculus var. scolymus TaxID=59895 RepID=UPI000D62A3A0|nr:polyadenylate-binding protein 7-like [Cynara cardunculus var. scolymus]
MASSSPSLIVPASLYVGDLHPEINDIQLTNAFSDYKSLSSVRVCRDSSTGRSLCYGYVNFLSPQEATRAIEAKNNTMLYGKMIRVTRANRDPDVRNGIGNVFVKNLNESIDNVQLQELFQSFGNILSCKVSTFEDGKSKGYGYVQFESEESSNAAIENLNGTSFGGKQIYVGKFMKKSDRLLPSPDAKYTNLYIKNLDLDITEDVLKQKFSVFGNIVSLVIVQDDNGVSKGFGFVNFENPDDAKKATEAMNGLNLGAKVLYVGRAQKKSEREQILRRQFEEWRKEQISKYQGSNVYVKNINDNVTENELRECFSQCGTITSAKLMINDKGMSKGFGFVCFSTPEEANKAVNTFHGYMFHGKPLYVAIAQRKEERQAQLQIQYAQRLAGIAGPSTIIPGGYPPLYYTTRPGIISQVPPRPGLMYQPMGIRPGWMPNTYAPPTRPAETSSLSSIFDGPRLQRQNRGRMNGHMHSQDGPQTVPYVSHLQQPVQTSTDSSNQQRVGQVRYAPNGYVQGSNKGSSSAGPEMLSTMLAAASPEIQKQILGERLYPLVNQFKPDLAAKITGMLLEMDNLEVLLLLESPEALASKVEEAVQVLELSNKTKVSSQQQESLHPNLLSAQVAVN